MTLDQAVAELRAAGLQVSAGPDGFVAAADTREPHPVVAEQGVSAVFDFGFSARRHGAIWFLRHHGNQRGPAEEYDRVQDVVERGLTLFSEYRRAHPSKAVD